MTGAQGPCHKQGRPRCPGSSSAVERSPDHLSSGGAPTGDADAAGGIRGGSSPSRRRIRPLARRRDATYRRRPAPCSLPRPDSSFTSRFTGGPRAARGAQARQSAADQRGDRDFRVPSWAGGCAPSTSCAGGAASEPRSSRQPVRSAPLGRCSMNSAPSSKTAPERERPLQRGDT